jgi:hypothetical protein
VGNNGLLLIDALGLYCDEKGNEFHGPPCCKGKPGIEWVTDDAGRRCCKDEVIEVILEIDMSGIGHAGIGFSDDPEHSYGWFPGFKAFFDFIWGPGTFDDSKHVFDEKDSKRYVACSQTAEILRNSINRNKTGNFSVLNVNGLSCTGWACFRLSDAGLTPPNGINGHNFPIDKWGQSLEMRIF